MFYAWSRFEKRQKLVRKWAFRTRPRNQTYGNYFFYLIPVFLIYITDLLRICLLLIAQKYLREIRFFSGRWPRDHFILKIQSELCHPKCARKVSGLSRKGPRLTGTSYRGIFSVTLFVSEGLPVVFGVFVKMNHNPLFNGSFQNLSFLQACAQRLREQDSLTNVTLCMRTAMNTSFKESKLPLAGYNENEDKLVRFSADGYSLEALEVSGL